MDHHTDVRLVDAHAKCVGRCDHCQFTLHEALLDVLLGLRLQTPVKTTAGRAGCCDQLRHRLRRFSRGTEHDCGTAVFELVSQEFDDALGLLRLAGCDDEVGQVLALVAAQEPFKLQAQALTKVRTEVVDDGKGNDKNF